MVFVIVQIRSECRILKNWFGCAVPADMPPDDIITYDNTNNLPPVALRTGRQEDENLIIKFVA